ncbi:MAG: hypothetical protein N2643_02470 [Endomicrobia bacterium]|nr:hypothetical protein [Endomicrobiia bacterium]
MKANKEENKKVKCKKCGKEVDIKKASIQRVSTCCSVYEIVLCKKCSGQKENDTNSCWSCC